MLSQSSLPRKKVRLGYNVTDRLEMNIAVQIKHTNKATQISTMNIIWDMSTENRTFLHAYTKDADQHVHLRSLVSAFAIDPLKKESLHLYYAKFQSSS